MCPRFPKYYPQEWLQAVTEQDVQHRLELRHVWSIFQFYTIKFERSNDKTHSTGQGNKVIHEFSLSTQAWPHDHLDFAILHFQDDIEAAAQFHNIQTEQQVPGTHPH